MTRSPFPDLSQPAAGRWILTLAAVLFFWNLWGYDLWAPDEPFFGEGAREMVVEGQWLVPHVNGQVNNHKPPLFFWLIAGFSKVLGGVSSFTARLPSALAGLGTLWLTMLLARRLRSAEAAALCGVMMVTSHMFWEKSRSSQIDATLCFLTTCAILSFEAFRSGRWSGRRAGLVFWGACGLATLAKGPVGLIIPLGVVLATSVWDRRLLDLRQFAPLLGPSLFLAIGLAWAVPATLYVEGYSALQALQEHFVERSTQGLHHVRPWWYYGKVLPYALLPWTFLLPGAALLAWRRRSDPADRLLLAWAVFVVLMFSVSTEKRDLYILPAFPAFFLMIGRLVAHHLGWWRSAGQAAEQVRTLSRQWVFVPLGAIAAVLFALSLYAPMLARQEAPAEVFPWSLALGAGIAAGAVWLVLALRRHAADLAILRLASVTSVLLLCAVTFVYPRMNPAKSGRELAGVVQQELMEQRRTDPDARVFGLDIWHLHRHVSFYSNGIYVDIVDARQFAAQANRLLAAGRPVLLFSGQPSFEKLPFALRARAEVLHQTRLSRRDVALVRFQPAAQRLDREAVTPQAP